MELFVVWVFLSIGAGAIAGSKGRSAGGFFLLSLVLSPVVGIIAALVASRSHRRQQGSESAEDELADGSFEVVVTMSGGSSYGQLEGPTSTSEQCWLKPGVRTSVKGYDIPAGMLYVGERLPAVSRWCGLEPAARKGSLTLSNL